MSKERKTKGLIGINKFTITLILIYFLCGVGVTYAYFAFNYENTSVIVGNVVAIDADLSVELVVGSNDGLVPMTDAALSNAINGVGSDNGACVDSLGNLSCQVYKITLTNNGSRLQDLTGTIELYAKSGTGNVYSNLKWQELTDTTTVKDGSIVNGMSKSELVSGLTLNSKESKTWYVGVWLSEIDADQTNTDKGDFGGTVTFEAGDGSGGSGIVEGIGSEFIDSVMVSNAQSDADISFSTVSSSSGTNGIYLRSGTENDTYPIYYYRGAVDNNLIFADTCWKIVRTTETGGLKLIYNGTPTDGQCNNSGDSSQVTTKAFNSSYTSPAYVGYMYGTVYTRSSKTMSSVTDTYYYGNDVSYADGTYTLTDTITSSDWSSIYSSGLNNYHYTCFSTGTTCTSVYYIYYTNSSKAYYITLTDGKKVEDALSEMLDNNTTSSTIKGNNTTSGTLDYWYYTNIDQTGYGDYVEDTIWCNDRSIYQKNGWDPDGGSMTAYLYFGAYERAYSTYEPNLSCSRDVDKFTVSDSNGNGDLDYPVGLLTADEVMLAGGKGGTTNNTYYLYTGSNYWAGSPYYFYLNYASEFIVTSTGYLSSSYVNYTSGVRPSISLKRGFSIASGDGKVETPYVVS